MPYLLQQLLTESARRAPSQAAVVGPGGTLTYRELEDLSNKLAHALSDAGVGPGDRVGIFMEKCVDAVAAIFAVLKAGAAYVPVDPHAPPRRAAFILADCDVRCLIGERARLAKLPAEFLARPELAAVLITDRGSAPTDAPPDAPTDALAGLRAIALSEVRKRPPAEPPGATAIECDLAYILYTSGSTGEPKGVMVSHRGALTFVDWCRDTFGLSAQDRISSHAPFHFDLSIFDLYCSVQAGATIHLVPGEATLFPRKLAEWVEQSRISVWYSVPSALTQMLEHGALASRRLGGLRLVLFAGEVFPIKHLRRLARALPGAALYNLYGPTETNVCTFHRVRPEDLDEARTEPVPIGRACANMDVVALSEAGHLASPGGEGELYVRSAAVMKGYWGRPAETDRALLPDVRRKHLRDALYRTGDLVRVLPDGSFQYLGRRDKMIKSRGYRIELGEIEAALHAHPRVREAAVVAVPDEEIGARIRAFVASDGAIGTSELQKHCGERIPRYMMPERIELCAELPRTSTGKIDRAALEKLEKKEGER